MVNDGAKKGKWHPPFFLVLKGTQKAKLQFLGPQISKPCGFPDWVLWRALVSPTSKHDPSKPGLSRAVRPSFALSTALALLGRMANLLCLEYHWLC